MKVAIAKDANAIGYLGIGHVDNTVKAVKINGVEPSQENSKSGAYLGSAPTLYEHQGRPDAFGQGLYRLYLNPEGAKISQKHGYIPINSYNEAILNS